MVDALKGVRDISRICREEMRESNHMRDITHLYPIIYYNNNAICWLSECWITIRMDVWIDNLNGGNPLNYKMIKKYKIKQESV